MYIFFKVTHSKEKHIRGLVLISNRDRNKEYKIKKSNLPKITWSSTWRGGRQRKSYFGLNYCSKNSRKIRKGLAL